MLRLVKKFLYAAILTVLITFQASTIAAGELRLSVTEPTGVARSGWPVTSGIPLARGALSHSENVTLASDTGKMIPVQAEALSRWPDGSIRWLLVDFQTSLEANATSMFTLRYGDGIRTTPVADPVQVRKYGAGIQLETGPLRIELSRSSFRLLDAVWLDCNRDGHFGSEERMTKASGAGIVPTLRGSKKNKT